MGGCTKNAFYLQKYSCLGLGFYHAADTTANYSLAWQSWWKLLNFGTSNRYFYHTETLEKLTICRPVISNTAVYCMDMSVEVPQASLKVKADYATMQSTTTSENNTCATVSYANTAALNTARGN
jgi:hypothetical protein